MDLVKRKVAHVNSLKPRGLGLTPGASTTVIHLLQNNMGILLPTTVILFCFGVVWR